jgi:hypothetical protein
MIDIAAWSAWRAWNVSEDVLNEIVARYDFECRLVEHPLRHERALSTVRAYRAEWSTVRHCADFMIHQDGEGAVAIVERTEAVRDASHLVTAHAVASGQQ